MPLHPQSEAFLAAVAAAGRPGWNEMPLDIARHQFCTLTDLFGDGPDLARVQDLQTECGIRLRLYQANPEKPGPTIMFFHGGGFVLGNIESHDTVCRLLTQYGECTVISVDYRLAPEHRCPLALDDCFKATKYAAENASALNIDRAKLVVAGDSAGGHLAAGVAIRCRDEGGPNLQSQLLIYPVVSPYFNSQSYLEFAEGYGLSRDVMMWFWDQYLGENSAEMGALHPAQLHGLPPALVCLAECDVLRSEGEELASKLTSAGVSTTVKTYHGMLHGFVHFAGVFNDAHRALKDVATVVKSL